MVIRKGCLITIFVIIAILIIIGQLAPKRQYREPTYQEQIDKEARERLQQEQEAERQREQEMRREMDIERKKWEMKEQGY